MNLDRDTLQNAVGPETVESIGEIVLGIGALAFVVALASLLSGLDLPVPQTPVTLAASSVRWRRSRSPGCCCISPPGWPR